MMEGLLIGTAVVASVFLTLLIVVLIFSVFTGEIKFTKKCFGISFKQDKRHHDYYDVWWSFLWIGTDLCKYIRYDDTYHYVHRGIHFKKDKALPMLYLKKYNLKKFDRMREQ